MTLLKGTKLARLTALLDERQALADQIKALDLQKKALDAALLDLATAAGGTVETAQYLARVVTAKQSRLSKERLMELGVRATVIAQATIETAYTYVKVTRKQE